MIAKELDAITKEDIDSLKANGVREGRSIEYKERLPQGSDEDTREFLADASSFANANGGDLIYGVRPELDTNGKPTGLIGAVEGLKDINPDQQMLRLENLMRDAIDPRIPNVRIKAVTGFQAGPVIIIRIKRSWAPPHMVKYKGSSRFFSRNSAGKYQLDVRELRSLFLASEVLSEKVDSFRANRISKILAKETPTPLTDAPKLVVHLLPIHALSDPSSIDLRKAEADWREREIKPPGKPQTWGPAQYNFNGLLMAGTSGHDGTGYIQLFRNGVIEYVSARIVVGKFILGVLFEQETFATKAIQDFQMRFEVGPPLIVAVSLLSVKGYAIYPVPPTAFNVYHGVQPIEEDVILAPEFTIEETGANFRERLRPGFDAFWQASGWPGSTGYEATGTWRGYAEQMNSNFQ